MTAVATPGAAPSTKATTAACVVGHPSFAIEGASPPEMFADWLALAKAIAPSIAATAKSASAARTALCAAGDDVACRAPICTSDAALVWSRAVEWTPVLVLVRDDGKLASWPHVGESIWSSAYCDDAACSTPPTLRYAKGDRRVHLSFVDRAAAKAGCFDAFREEEWLLDAALVRRARVVATTEIETGADAPTVGFPRIEVADDGTVKAFMPGCPPKVRAPNP